MRRISALIVFLAATALPQAPARAAPFDGTWSVTQECEPAPGGARGFKWMYDATVKDGRLLGQYGMKDKPSSLTLTGRIQADGTATLMASGLNGKSEYTVGFGQPGEKFSYPVPARFEAARHGHADPGPDVPVFLREDLSLLRLVHCPSGWNQPAG